MTAPTRLIRHDRGVPVYQYRTDPHTPPLSVIRRGEQVRALWRHLVERGSGGHLRQLLDRNARGALRVRPPEHLDNAGDGISRAGQLPGLLDEVLEHDLGAIRLAR